MTAATIDTCGVCGIVLGAGETQSAEQARRRHAELQRTAALEEERADVVRALEVFRQKHAAAEKFGDEQGRIGLEYRVKHAEERLEHIDATAPPTVERVPDGACAGCGVIYRDGFVSLESLRDRDRDRRERTVRLSALEADLASAHARQQVEEAAAGRLAESGDRASQRQADEHLERAEHAAARVSDIERAIVTVRAELAGLAAPPAARAERRPGKLGRRQSRQEATR